MPTASSRPRGLGPGCWLGCVFVALAGVGVLGLLGLGRLLAAPPRWPFGAATATATLPPPPWPHPQIVRSPTVTHTPPTAVDATAVPSPPAPPSALRDPAAWSTYQALLTAQPLVHDRVAVYTRLTGRAVTWATPTPHPALPVGTRQTFYVTDTDGVQAFPVEAELAAVSDHAYLWVDARLSYAPTTAQRLVREFETHIYPTTRGFFGSEPSPGIDGDPHLYILFAQGVGSVAGYFSSADALPPEVHRFSNAHEMFILSASMLDDNEGTYAVLAHEFQHMIHQQQDPDETSWLNEGFSELAVLLNGYDHGFFDGVYLSAPDIPLLHWPDPAQASSLPFYGGGFLFTLYFLERFGAQATQALVHEPANSVAGVQAVLQRIGARHPVTGAPLRAEDVFLDWAIANYLADPDLADGRFGYTRRRIRPAEPTVRTPRCPAEAQSGEVFPFGVDYLQVTCSGHWRLEVALDPWAPLWPVAPPTGTFVMWSGYGDESDMRLTRTFDLTGVAAGQPVTLTYRTWYDIETDYDYGYVLASTDGEHWTMLRPPHATDRNPVGNNYGWGYTGTSEGWLTEEVDLSAYAGRQVHIRFEYLTDAAVNHWGWLLDDIAIPAIGYHEDFERGPGGWQAEGWALAAHRIPRTYRAALVLQGQGQTEVRYLDLGPAPTRLEVELPLDGQPWQTATLVLMDTTRFARYPARYAWAVDAP